MKRFLIALLLGLTAMLVACGSGSSNMNTANSVTGNWTASLTNPSGTPVLSFTTSLTQNSDNSITGTNLNFTTATPCFGQGATETGGFAASGNFNGTVTSVATLSIQSGPPGSSGNNILNMQGAFNNNTINGTWMLTGPTSGCTGSGNFTMTRF